LVTGYNRKGQIEVKFDCHTYGVHASGLLAMVIVHLGSIEVHSMCNCSQHCDTVHQAVSVLTSNLNYCYPLGASTEVPGCHVLSKTIQQYPGLDTKESNPLIIASLVSKKCQGSPCQISE